MTTNDDYIFNLLDFMDTTDLARWIVRLDDE